MVRAEVVVKNTGDIDYTFWMGVSKGRGLSGSGCSLGFQELLWDAPVAPVTLEAGNSSRVNIQDIPDASTNDEYCIVKIWKSSNATECFDGASEAMPSPTVSAEIISLDIYKL